MNVSDLEHKLLAAARASRPSEAVPYAFEKRVMARLANPPPLDLWSLWSHQFWRAAIPCLALTLLLGGFTLYSSANSTHAALQNDIEDTMLAAIDQGGEGW
jgi:hypothetical protein